MRKLCTLILGAVVLSGSACKMQNVVSGSTVYQLKQNAATHQNELWSYQVKTYSDEIVPTADNLIVLDETSMVLKPGISTMIPLTNMPKALFDAAGNDYFFSDVSSIVKKSYKDFPANKPGFPVAGNLAVNQGYAVLQALTIPFKFRSAVSATVPSTVETGFTGNFSFGYKFARNYYKAKKDFLGLNRTGLSFTPGVFAGLGTTSFSETTVPGAPAGYSRTSLTKSVGLFALVGIGRFGFGYAGGWDFASGDRHQNWIYQKKWWNGVAFSLDLVNF